MLPIHAGLAGSAPAGMRFGTADGARPGDRAERTSWPVVTGLTSRVHRGTGAADARQRAM
jgi:hypothetical protein